MSRVDVADEAGQKSDCLFPQVGGSFLVYVATSRFSAFHAPYGNLRALTQFASQYACDTALPGCGAGVEPCCTRSMNMGWRFALISIGFMTLGTPSSLLSASRGPVCASSLACRGPALFEPVLTHPFCTFQPSSLLDLPSSPSTNRLSSCSPRVTTREL